MRYAFIASLQPKYEGTTMLGASLSPEGAKSIVEEETGQDEPAWEEVIEGFWIDRNSDGCVNRLRLID